jgi:hypothetical protein
VLQQARPSDVALLRDVAYDEGGHAGPLGPAHQVHRALAELDNAARGLGRRLRVHRLDRVDDEQARREGLCLPQGGVQVRLGEDEQPFVPQAQAGGAQLDLAGRLLAREVKDGTFGSGEGSDLEEEGGLADAGVAADKGERAGDDASAQHAIELRQTDGEPGLVLVGQAGELQRGS